MADRSEEALPNRSATFFRVAQNNLLGGDLDASLAWHPRWAVKPRLDSMGNLCVGQKQVIDPLERQVTHHLALHFGKRLHHHLVPGPEPGRSRTHRDARLLACVPL